MCPGWGRSAGEGIGYPLQYSCDSAGKESTCNVGDLGSILVWEDPLEKEIAMHSSILAWRFHGLHSPWGCKESDSTEQLSLSLSLEPINS